MADIVKIPFSYVLYTYSVISRADCPKRIHINCSIITCKSKSVLVIAQNYLGCVSLSIQTPFQTLGLWESLLMTHPDPDERAHLSFLRKEPEQQDIQPSAADKVQRLLGHPVSTSWTPWIWHRCYRTSQEMEPRSRGSQKNWHYPCHCFPY